MSKIQLLSDVHSRWNRVAFDPEAKLIIAAGDLVEGTDGVDWLADSGVPVLYIPGNHEFYDEDVATRLDQLKHRAAGTSVSIMNRGVALAGDIRFICATLWTDHNGLDAKLMERSLKIMNDYRQIRIDRWLSDEANRRRYEALHREFESTNPNLSGILPAKPEFMNPIAALCLHQQDVEHIAKELAKPWKGRTIVVTHHAPSTHSLSLGAHCPVAEVGALAGYLPWPVVPHKIGAYASSLEYLFSNHRIEMWMHGHLHEGLRYSIYGSDVITNPTGYTDEQNLAYRPGFCIELDDHGRHAKTLARTAHKLLDIQQHFILALMNALSEDPDVARAIFSSPDAILTFGKLYNLGISPMLQQAPKDVPQPSFRATLLQTAKILDEHGLSGNFTPQRRQRVLHQMLTQIQVNKKRTQDWLAYLLAQPATCGWTPTEDICA